jgi:putative spermidine/putrescine transport system substrate-binding protein
MRNKAFLGGLALAVLAAPLAQAQVSAPVKLSIIDVAGNLVLSKPAIEAFKAANPQLVSDIEYIKLTSPELVSKIKAQQMGGNLDTTMVITGVDGMASGVEAGIYDPLMPAYNSDFQATVANYLPGAKATYDLFKGAGLVYVFCPGGPMLTYNPDKIPNPPKTAEELLAWAKANPGKFMYARPANSGPGRAFLMGLPYILGDKDPKNPETWDKTWAFLKELGQYIDYYPTGTGITFKEMAEGTRWMLASHIGWDIQQRVLATIPANSQGLFLKGSTWVNDAHFVAIPKGLDKDRKYVTIQLIKYLMQPQQQAMAFGGSGYFYPGPAIKGVTIDMAPADIQSAVKPAVRPEYIKAIASLPNTTQLDAKAMVKAFDIWDKTIGSQKK